ncbi:MAG: hypothetical protein H0W61_16230 [Bacteroidetes bacterium]|nr:hypothetical protein [Bacteroidota bacterium]
MKTSLFKLFIPLVMILTALSACSHDNGSDHNGNKDNDNRGNHATDPPEPSDAEYPGSKTYDSLHLKDSVRQ